ncbi:MAG: PHP domain-containing protein [Clostridium butyricum]|nr:PHP domain-containing protein [Clostridium butyricum]
MVKVDFHVHTSASDGILSPSEIIKRAKSNNLKFVAITDHDTLTGLKEAFSESIKYGITLIPGIELSTQHNNESVHILGFFKDDSFKNPELIKELNKIKNHRIERAKEIVSKLKSEFNIILNFDTILEQAHDTIGRVHIAKAIIDAGYNYNSNEIFDKFIGKDCKAYVPTLQLSTKDGIKLLKKYNALAFLAHPKLINNTPISEFLTMNLDGIESIYFQNNKEETKSFIEIAEVNNLLISCGSDFHGNIKNDLRHGDIGSVDMPKKYLIKFLNALEIYPEF